MAKKKRTKIDGPTEEEVANLKLRTLQIEVTRTLRIMQDKYKRVLAAGTLMSNWCQMLAMQSGRRLDEQERNSLRDAYEQWDKAVNS